MKLYKFIERLRDFSKENLIVVEGKKDKKILEELGIKNIYTIREILNKESFNGFKKVLILTDNDKKGRKLYKNLKYIFESDGIIVNEKFRIQFYKIFKINKVEYLNKKINRIKFYLDYYDGNLDIDSIIKI